MSRRPRVTTPVSPKAITANDVQRLLDGCDIGDPGVVREYPILMPVARVGLGSIEAARLQLDDLDWRSGRIVLRGKASREDGMPRPADVGEALSAHLRQARPATSEPPGIKCGRAGSAITTSNGSQAASDTQLSTVAGAGNLNLSVAADGTIVIRSNRAKL